MKTISEQIIHLKPEDLSTFHPEPGKIYSGLPNEQYHSFSDYESSTTVKPLTVTLKHREDYEHKETDALSFGALFHDSMESLRTGKPITEFSRVVDNYGKVKKEDAAAFILKYYSIVFGKEYDKTMEELISKKVSRDELHEIAANLEELFLDGRQKVTTESFERSNAMVDAIKGHPMAGRMIELHGHAELSFFAEIDIDVDGVPVPIKVRVRPDEVIEFEDEVWINDWKSIGEEATDKNIAKALWRWRYDMQAAMYTDVMSKFTDKEVFFRFIFAESNKPAKEKVRVVQLPDWDMEAGWWDYRNALEKKARWILDNSIWKGYPIPEDGIDIIPMRKPQY